MKCRCCASSRPAPSTGWSPFSILFARKCGSVCGAAVMTMAPRRNGNGGGKPKKFLPRQQPNQSEWCMGFVARAGVSPLSSYAVHMYGLRIWRCALPERAREGACAEGVGKIPQTRVALGGLHQEAL